MEIAVVVPTNRQELYENTFIPAWEELFTLHNVWLVTVFDNLDPSQVKIVACRGKYNVPLYEMTAADILQENLDLLSNRNAGIKNLGFAFIAKMLPSVERIIALDDDVTPVGDTILDHLDVLEAKAPISWMPVGDVYTRGFPYGVRDEAEIVLSHGVWGNVPDLDAPTQLTRGVEPMNFHKIIIPKGIFYPMCEMNIAFKRKMLPYMYLAPVYPDQGIDRCDDIFCGIESKKIIDDRGWAVASGFSTVFHTRASNVFTNLIKEAKFIQLNENFWKGEEDHPYFSAYKEKRDRWAQFIRGVDTTLTE